MTDAVEVTMVESDDDPDEVPSDAVKKTLGIGFWLAVGWLGVVVLAAIFAPILPINDPKEILVGDAKSGPSWGLWFGTDQLGRDTFARTIWGARVSLVVGVFAIVFGMVVGGSLGICAGYFRGKFDQVVSFMFFTLLSFPALVLAILITTTISRSLMVVSLTIGILAVAPVGRLARAATLIFADREFVHAARVIGAKDGRIIIREILPNVMIPMGALVLLGMGIAIVAEGALAFLGLSVIDSESWGQLIVLGSVVRELKGNPSAAMFPILVMFLTVLSLNFAGDRVREYFDVRETAF